MPAKTERLHSLDSLRAIMMLLGPLLHTAITYRAAFELPWPLNDPYDTHIIYDILIVYIHTFRMPIFFIIAGFFGAMLFNERGPGKMIKNRFSRIILPFVVFVFIINILNVFAFGYSRHALSGSAGDPFASFHLLMLIPRQTGHLWFLYYLSYITVAGICIALIARKFPRETRAIIAAFDWIFSKAIARIFAFASMTAVIYLINGTSEIKTSGSVIPAPETFMFYGSFYLIGWLLYQSKRLLASMEQYSWTLFAAGNALVFVKFGLYIKLGLNPYQAHVLSIAVNSLSIWTLIFGITGLFIRYFSHYSKTMRYISDASYWIYLIHLPIVALMPGLIVNWPIAGFAKFLIVLTVTLFTCFLSYHYMVRFTFIGQFLNGRKYGPSGNFVLVRACPQESGFCKTKG